MSNVDNINDSPFFLNINNSKVFNAQNLVTRTTNVDTTQNTKRTLESPTSTINSGEFALSLQSNDSPDKQTNLQAIISRLRKLIEVISALVKDIHEKLYKELLDARSILNSLNEIQRNVENFSNLQKTALYFELADEIDELGVGIWNTSIALKTSGVARGPDNSDEMIALFRQVGFVMIQAGAGASVNTEIKTAVKLLLLANKVGKAWLDCGRSDKADEILRSANTLEDTVLSWQEKSAKELQSRSTALVVYYAYRAEAAWKLTNGHVANLMIQHATEKEYLDHITIKEIDILCQVCFTVGYQASREGKVNEAIKWLRKCHELISDRISQINPERIKILTSTLNILATCYLKIAVHDESNLDLGENAINACLEEDPGNVLAISLKLKIMKQRNFDPVTYEEVYIHLMRTGQVTKENLKVLLNVAHTISEFDVMMALRGLDILIEEKLSDIRKIEFIEKAIVAKFHILGNCESENLDLNDAIRNIEVTLGFEQRYGIVIGQKTKAACQLILWQKGDQNYANRQYDRAKKWYAVAYKSLAVNQADGRNAAILQRKIALCHLEDHALADATEAVRQAQLHEKNSAANFYILFHVAMEKRQIAQAIQHLHEMCKGDEFHGNMLTMAAHEAYQKGNKAVLVEALKEILEKHEKGEDIANVDIFVLLRCLIRMTYNSLSGDEMEKASLKNYICEYFEIALNLIKTTENDQNKIDYSIQKKRALLKDLEWYFKTAWNMGLEFCQQAEEGSEMFSIQLFDIAYKFLNEYPEETLEHINRKRLCIFTSMCGRLFLSRQQKSISQKKDLLQQVLASVDQYKKLKKTLGKRKRSTLDDDIQENKSSAQSDMILIILFEFEAKVKLGLWNELLTALDAAEAYDFDVPPRIFERMAELLISENECPSTVIFSTLQVLLDSITKRKQVDIEQFSRWFRMLIITSMVKDRHASAQYFDQALDILSQECSKQKKYPEEEIQWLMVNAWNYGIDYYSVNDFVNAKKWCETAIAFCRFMDNGLLYEEEVLYEHDSNNLFVYLYT
ncbi:testis-expressed sequence 11 protein-like [Gigaspora margarita]|uniref:Protein ZIP4 homolog n=1 Tax=Gigaspora margarita TaxID=4874 RepID=A0A8H4A3K4_GIGMA|nr:testis-expressed sequence 11 protein-like [Gigaspora margarita]